jgi:hypothetical protein
LKRARGGVDGLLGFRGAGARTRRNDFARARVDALASSTIAGIDQLAPNE